MYFQYALSVHIIILESPVSSEPSFSLFAPNVLSAQNASAVLGLNSLTLVDEFKMHNPTNIKENLQNGLCHFWPDASSLIWETAVSPLLLSFDHSHRHKLLSQVCPKWLPTSEPSSVPRLLPARRKCLLATCHKVLAHVGIAWNCWVSASSTE